MFKLDLHSKPNEQLFSQTGGHSATLIETAVTSSFTYFLFKIRKQNKTRSIMGCFNAGDHIAEDDIKTDLTTCDIEKPQQKYHLGTVSNKLLGAGA